MTRRRWTVALLTATFLPLAIWGRGAYAGQPGGLSGENASPTGSAFRGTEVRAELRLGSVYNSNPLLYSSEDEAAFLNHNPASRFAIRSFNDAALRGDAALTLTRRLAGNGPTRFSLGYSWNSFAQNPIKNAHTARASIRQPLSRRAWLELGFLNRPHSYLRHLWDPDYQAPYQSYPRYQPAYLSTREIEASAGARLTRRWAVDGTVTRLRLDYNTTFNERDSHGWVEAIELSWGRQNGPTLAFSPSFMQRKAKAHDPIHLDVPDSLRTDISSHEWDLTLSGGLPAGSVRWIPLEVRMRVMYLRRTFTSARVADLFHHGRKDRAAGVSIDLERALTHAVSVFGSGRYGAQWTSGIEATGSLGEVASWRQLVVGGGIRAAWSGSMPW